MGVLACSKTGCDLIMCETYVPMVGYVCRDCQDRFKAWLKGHGVHPKTEGELEQLLRNYLSLDMDFTDKHQPSGGIDIDEFFQSHTHRAI